jgi:hypothetical protein
VYSAEVISVHRDPRADQQHRRMVVSMMFPSRAPPSRKSVFEYVGEVFGKSFASLVTNMSCSDRCQSPFSRGSGDSVRALSTANGVVTPALFGLILALKILQK